MECLSYGFHPAFAVNYKHYPIGLVDGVEFEHVQIDQNKFDAKQHQYFDAVYARCGKIVITRRMRTDVLGISELEHYKIAAGPGSTITFRKDPFDIDYCTEFRCEDYK